MKLKNLYCYFKEEIFTGSLYLGYLVIEVLFLILGYLAKASLLIIYLKLFTIITTSYYFLLLIQNRIEREALFFIGSRLRLNISLIALGLKYVTISSLIGFFSLKLLSLKSGISLEYSLYIDYLFYYLSVFGLFLIIYNLFNEGKIIAILFLMIITIFINIRMPNYNYLNLNLESYQISLENPSYVILIEPVIKIITGLFLGLKKVKK